MGAAIGHHRLDQLFGHRLLAVPVGDQLGAAEQALAAHIADHPVLVHQRAEIAHQPLAHRQRVGQKPLVLDDPHVLQRRRRPGGAAAEGGEVAEIVHRVVGIGLEQVEHRLGGDQAGDRGIARGHALGHRHHVGLDAVILVAEPGAGAADAADHLVDMQQHVILAANLLHPLPVAFRRGDHAAAGGDRLEAERAHRVGTLAQDHLLDRIGGAQPVIGDHAPLAAVFQAMRHGHEARREGSVLRVALVLAAAGERGDGGAVVIALAEEDLVLLAAETLVGDLADHLEGLLVRLRSGIGVVDAGHPRHLVDQPLGEARAGDRARRTGEIVEPDQLLAHRVGDAFAAIAHIHRPDPAGNRVEQLLAALVPDPHPLALDDDPGIARLELLVLDHVMPDMRLVGGDDAGEVVFLDCAVHGGLLTAGLGAGLAAGRAGVPAGRIHAFPGRSQPEIPANR